MKMRESRAQPLRVVETVQKQARQVTIHHCHHSYYQDHHYFELEMETVQNNRSTMKLDSSKWNRIRSSPYLPNYVVIYL